LKLTFHQRKMAEMLFPDLSLMRTDRKKLISLYSGSNLYELSIDYNLFRNQVKQEVAKDAQNIIEMQNCKVLSIFEYDSIFMMFSKSFYLIDLYQIRGVGNAKKCIMSLPTTFSTYPTPLPSHRKWNYSKIVEIYPRTYGLRKRGLEIFSSEHSESYLLFEDEYTQDLVYKKAT